MKFNIGDIVRIRPGSRSARWFDGLGPFRFVGQYMSSDWLRLKHLDGSRCHKLCAGDDADPNDCYQDKFLQAAHEAIKKGETTP